MKRQKQAGFAANMIGPSGLKPGDARSDVLARAKPQLVMRFKTELLKPQYNPLQMYLEFSGFLGLTSSIYKFEDTAAVAVWRRKCSIVEKEPVGGEAEAISLLLTGVDRSADDDAIRWVEQFRDVEGKPLPFKSKVYAGIRQDPRPYLVTLYWQENHFKDPSIRYSAESLAQAFFDQFGVEGKPPRLDKKP